MDIQALVEGISWHEHAVLAAMHWEEGTFVFVLETSLGDTNRRRFRIACVDAVEVELVPGRIEELDCATEHPLLLQHSGPQADLFFSSSPNSPGEIFLAAHEVIDRMLQGWRDPRQILCHGPGQFASVLARGHGLLARGPAVLVEALGRRLQGLLEVNAVHSYRKDDPLIVLTADSGYVVCASVEVTELAA